MLLQVGAGGSHLVPLARVLQVILSPGQELVKLHHVLAEGLEAGGQVLRVVGLHDLGQVALNLGGERMKSISQYSEGV